MVVILLDASDPRKLTGKLSREPAHRQWRLLMEVFHRQKFRVENGLPCLDRWVIFPLLDALFASGVTALL